MNFQEKDKELLKAMDALNNPDAKTGADEIYVLEYYIRFNKIEERIIETLLKSINSKYVGTRARSVFALKMIANTTAGDDRVIKALINAMNDPSSEVRKKVAYTLGEIHDKRTIEPLIKGLNDPKSKHVRKTSAEALGKKNDERVINALYNVANDPDSEIREESIHSLGSLLNIFNNEKVLDLLISLIKDPNPIIRNSVVSAIGPHHDKRTFTFLKESLYDPDFSGRVVSFKSLARSIYKNKDKMFLEELINNFKHPDSDFREMAISSACSYCDLDDERILNPLINTLEDPEPEIRLILSWCLERGMEIDERIPKAIINAALNEDNQNNVELYSERIERQIFETYGVRSPRYEILLNQIKKELKNPDPKIRLNSIELLHAFLAHELIIAALEDQSLEVRSLAVENLLDLNEMNQKDPEKVNKILNELDINKAANKEIINKLLQCF